MLHARGHGNEKVLIYGAGGTGRRVFSVLKRSPKLGLERVAFVDDDSTKQAVRFMKWPMNGGDLCP